MAIDLSTRPVHIVGAGGVGMSGLALLLARMGADVSASDQNDSAYLEKLHEKGIETWVGSNPVRIKKGSHVYYSTAIKPEDAERNYAEAQGYPCESRHALLKLITERYFTIAIAGCHGKTTTSAWIALLLEKAGFDPTALIGGTVPDWNSNYREGHGVMHGKPLLVIEADESDRSFLSISTDVALVTNIDLDHTDVHANLETLKADFIQFANGAIASGGWFHVSKECEADFVALQLEGERKQWSETSVRPESRSVAYAGESFLVGLSGAHNLMNATLVLQLGKRLNIADETIASVLASFNGVNRRMQKLAHFDQLKLSVIDDYAHHPHEVQATLAALSAEYERLLIFWEPHRLSRFCHFHAEFAAVLQPYAAANKVYSLPIYASGDRVQDYPDAAKLFATFCNPPFQHISSEADFVRTRNEFGKAKTAAVFMGAGRSSEYAAHYVKWLGGL